MLLAVSTRTQRLVLFVDVQNTYRGARRAFFDDDNDPHICGAFDPMKIGALICSRPAEGTRSVLTEVRAYTGRPDSTKQPESYGPHMRQCAAWEAAGVTVIARTLRYPHDWPKSKPEEKGIDVALAVDFVTLAIDGAYDLGVILSTDTDLKPALEYVNRKRPQVCAVAAWTSPFSRARLGIKGKPIWCYWLDRDDYDAVADLTDYRAV